MRAPPSGTAPMMAATLSVLGKSCTLGPETVSCGRDIADPATVVAAYARPKLTEPSELSDAIELSEFTDGIEGRDGTAPGNISVQVRIQEEVGWEIDERLQVYIKPFGYVVRR